MHTYTHAEFRLNEDRILREIAKGAVYIHPTDTIYGIGCDATNTTAVQRVREAKGRPNTPFSVIAPNKDWIRANCAMTKEAEDWLAKLPGPYTLILTLKNKNCISPETNAGTDTIGVRLPDHWIQDVALALNKPLITTSANVTGRGFMTALENLHSPIRQATDFAIYEGPKEGKPSTIVDLTQGGKVIPR